jgi:hypothetical protein
LLRKYRMDGLAKQNSNFPIWGLIKESFKAYGLRGASFFQVGCAKMFKVEYEGGF